MSINYTHKAIKDLSKLSNKQAKQIRNKIQDYNQTGSGDIKALKGKYKGIYRLRVGDYRIFFTKSNNNDIIVSKVSNRREAY